MDFNKCTISNTVKSLPFAINAGLGALTPLIANNLDTVSQALPFLQMLLPGDIYAYAFAGLSIANILVHTRDQVKKPPPPTPGA